MNDDQIKHMVNRFLMWRLPEHFRPDAGISFKAEYNEEYNASRGQPPQRHEPVGTNLFDATRAEAMVRHMVEGLPQVRVPEGSVVVVPVEPTEAFDLAMFLPRFEFAARALGLFGTARFINAAVIVLGWEMAGKGQHGWDEAMKRLQL